jgi:hypothetical protein
MFRPNDSADFDELETIEAADNADQTGRRQLWERQVGESTKAYSAFQKYLNLSSRRTLREVAELSHCSGQNIARWSRRWFWVARVQAYDVIEEERFREQMSRDRLSMRRRQIALGIACQNIAAHGVREFQARVASGQPLDLGAEEIKSLLAIGSQLEEAGMGTEKDSKFTKIVVNMGHARYPGEACGCKCPQCVGCRGEGAVVDVDGMLDALNDAEDGDPKQLN